MFFLGPEPGSVPRLPPPASRRRHLLLSPQHCQIRLERREGSQRSESGASGKAGNNAAPARRPAPGLGPAPRWRWQWRWWRGPGREGITPAIRRSLPGARGRRAHARSAAPAAGPTGRALRRSRRWARSNGRGGRGGGVGGRARLPGSLRAGLTAATWLQSVAGVLPLPRWVARRRRPGKMTRRHQSGP